MANIKTLINMDYLQKLAITGGLESIEYSESTQTYKAHFKPLAQSATPTIIEYDLVINGCGVSSDLKSGQKLFKSLAEQDLVNFTPFNTLSIDPTCFRVRSKVTDRMYAVGPPVFGDRIIINQLINIAHQTQLVVKEIIKQLQTDEQQCLVEEQ